MPEPSLRERLASAFGRVGFGSLQFPCSVRIGDYNTFSPSLESFFAPDKDTSKYHPYLHMLYAMRNEVRKMGFVIHLGNQPDKKRDTGNMAFNRNLDLCGFINRRSASMRIKMTGRDNGDYAVDFDYALVVEFVIIRHRSHTYWRVPPPANTILPETENPHNDLSCAICLEDLPTARVSCDKCKHLICFECVKKSSNGYARVKCSLCREIYPQPIQDLILPNQLQQQPTLERVEIRPPYNVIGVRMLNDTFKGFINSFIIANGEYTNLLGKMVYKGFADANTSQERENPYIYLNDRETAYTLIDDVKTLIQRYANDGTFMPTIIPDYFAYYEADLTRDTAHMTAEEKLAIYIKPDRKRTLYEYALKHTAKDREHLARDIRIQIDNFLNRLRDVSKIRGDNQGELGDWKFFFEPSKENVM
jgi:hypothetical protein